MFGRIMPAPLLMPVMVTLAPPSVMRLEKALATVSVVMMASAARAQLSGRASARAAGSPAAMRSCGKGSMMTPVEKGNICSGDTLSCCASAMQLARARIKPSAPVPALALPVLMSMARMPCVRPSCKPRCSRQIWTGAAQKRFCVKTPPTTLPSSSNSTDKSLRPALRIPASAIPQRTPGTGKSSAAGVASRFTGMGISIHQGYRWHSSLTSKHAYLRKRSGSLSSTYRGTF